MDKVEELTRFRKFVLNNLHPLTQFSINPGADIVINTESDEYFYAARSRLISLIEYGVIKDPILVLMLGWFESQKEGHWAKRSCAAIKDSPQLPSCLKAIIKHIIRGGALTNLLLGKEKGFPRKFNVIFRFKDNGNKPVEFFFWKSGRLRKVEIYLPIKNTDSCQENKQNSNIIKNIQNQGNYKGFYFYDNMDFIKKAEEKKAKNEKEELKDDKLQNYLNELPEELCNKFKVFKDITSDELWEEWKPDPDFYKNLINNAVNFYKIIKLTGVDIYWLGYYLQPTHIREKYLNRDKIKKYEPTNTEIIIWGKEDTKVDEDMIDTFASIITKSDGIYDWVEEGKLTMRQHALRSAVAAIMARNMSHNIGSHVLNYLSNPEELDKIWVIKK